MRHHHQHLLLLAVTGVLAGAAVVSQLPWSFLSSLLAPELTAESVVGWIRWPGLS